MRESEQVDKIDKKVIPEEIIEFGNKAEALYELRDKYVVLLFGFRRARKCAIEAVKYRRKFLRKVEELYPEFSNGYFSYNLTQKTIWKTTIEDISNETD